MLEVEPIINNIVPFSPEEFFVEFLKDCPPVELCENEEGMSATRSEKRKRRKKKKLTGLSEQRRAANTRERRRIQELNCAFARLKNALPLPNVVIPKIEILRQAITWIDHLGNLLKDYDEPHELLDVKQMKTWRPGSDLNAREDFKRLKYDCLFQEFPDLNNTLTKEYTGLKGRLFTL